MASFTLILTVTTFVSNLKQSNDKDKMVELINNNPNPYRVLNKAAKLLSSDYKRPPKRPGEPLVDSDNMGGSLEVYVSNVSPPRGAGNNMHHGQWVLIRFEPRDNRYIVGYKSDGVAGNFDKRKSFGLSDASPEKIVEIAKSYNPPSRVIL